MTELNENVIFVRGAKNGAIYDLGKGKVYRVNADAVTVIERLASGIPAASPAEKEYVGKLTQNGLLSPDRAPRAFEHEKNEVMRPRFAWLELTERCNLRCVHCYEGECHDAPHELSFDKWRSVLDELKAAGFPRIQLTGGELFMRRDAKALMAHAANLGFEELTVFTNATLPDDETTDLLAALGVKVRFSLYGGSAEVHEAVTRVRGSFEKTVSNVKKMKAKGIDVSPAVVIMRDNQGDVENIARLVRELGLPWTGYDVIRNVRGGTQCGYMPTDPAVSRSCDRTRPYFTTSRERFMRALDANTCWYGKIAVDASGRVMPCVFARDVTLGDLSAMSVKKLLESPELKKHWYFDYSEVETCRDCEYRFACKDCRPLAMASSGDMHAKNPRCRYDPYKGEWK